MSPLMPPRSRYYDGRRYARFVDPLLSNLRGFAAAQVPDGARVLDAGCGTGALALQLAGRVARVTGVDRSPRMIEHARAEGARRGLANASFEVGDAASLGHLEDGAFDVATAVMVLHEMPPHGRLPALVELARVARRVVVIDFAAPVPWNLAGLRNRLFEIAAGREHLAAFRHWTRAGGLGALVAAGGLTIESTRRVDAGCLECTVLAGISRR